MSSPYDITKTPPKALTFDVFGTVVDWRTTVTETLYHAAVSKTHSSSLSSSTRLALSKLTLSDWGRFAQEWRESYKRFVMTFVPGETEWVDIDTHHHRSLIELLNKWNLEDLYTPDEIEDLSRIWHFLDPWRDSSRGLHKLGTRFVTATLSNGNHELLTDLQKHGKLGFQKLLSSADFKAYKPHPSVYRGAAKALGFEPAEVAMVAAHLGDLKAARACGFRTIYVERRSEEDWKPESEEHNAAKSWVDLWIPADEDGFVEVARRFGIEGRADIVQ